jgi:ATP-binding cassette subfamily F protein 3
VGSFVVVSHNRFFVTQVANKIWYIEDKQIKEYPGTFDEYEFWRKKNEDNQKAEPPKVEKKVTQEKPAQVKSNASNSHAAALKSLERDLAKAEEAISVLEEKKSKVEIELTNPDVFKDHQKLQKVKDNFEKVKQDLSTANKKWEEIAGAIDKLTAEQ